MEMDDEYAEVGNDVTLPVLINSLVCLDHRPLCCQLHCWMNYPVHYEKKNIYLKNSLL